jgi:uncharacterized protein YodC (DUF2158 family)
MNDKITPTENLKARIQIASYDPKKPLELSGDDAPRLLSALELQESYRERAPQVGALVRLKSGGPLMTVVGSYGDDAVRVAWFDYDKTTQQYVGAVNEGTVPVDALESSEAKPAW